MCGIFGVASTSYYVNEVKRQRTFYNGLLFNMPRGWDSTGIATVCTDRNSSLVEYYKRALCAKDFLETKEMIKRMQNFGKYYYVIGHCRSATRGSSVDANAHPFMYDHITLVHNGTVDSSVLPTKGEEPVDSASIAASMADKGELFTLERLEGAYSLVWYNQEDDTLNFARNKRKPMSLIFLEDENTFYFGSEWLTTLAVVVRNEEQPENEEVLITRPFHWYKFSREDFRKFQVTEYKEYVRPTYGPHYWTGWGPQDYKQQNLPIVVHGTENKKEQISTGEEGKTITKASTDQTSSQTPSTNESLDKGTTKNKEAPGAPTSARRIRQVMERLEKLGLTLNQLMIVEPRLWVPYKNQDNKIGMLGAVPVDKSRVFQVEVFQVTHDQWKLFHEINKLAVRVVNVHGGPEPKNTKVVGVIEESWTKCIEQKYRDKKKEAEGPNYDNAGKEDAAPVMFYGPGGKLISQERFLDLTKHGCSECTGFINPNDNGNILWVNDSPLCVDCSDNAEILQKHGIYELVQKALLH